MGEDNHKQSKTVEDKKVFLQQSRLFPFLSFLIGALAIVLVIFCLFQVYEVVSKIDFGSGVLKVIGSFGTELKHDEDGNTHILLLGVGGGDHPGAELTDSIMLLTLNHSKQYVSMISVPRDLYVKPPSGGGGLRINAIYDLVMRKSGEAAGYEAIKDTIEKVTGIRPQYVAKINFQGFVQVVDIMGGVEVHVPSDIIDTAYPNDSDNGYTTFILRKGKQVLDGKTALRYARTRHSSSDFDRSERQHDLLDAMKERAKSKGLLTNPGELKRLFFALSDNIHTDLDIREIIRGVADFADIKKDHIISVVLTDNPLAEGGFLYTPPRESFGGSFVLIPNGATPGNIEYYKDIQFLTDLVVRSPEIYTDRPTIALYNATKKNGLVSMLAQHLKLFGFNVVTVSNAPEQASTTRVVSYRQNIPQEYFDTLSLFLGPIQKEQGTLSDSPGEDVAIYIGESYTGVKK